MADFIDFQLQASKLAACLDSWDCPAHFLHNWHRVYSRRNSAAAFFTQRESFNASMGS